MITALTVIGPRNFNCALEAIEWQAVIHSDIFILDGIDLSHLDIVQREKKHLAPKALTTFQALDEFNLLKQVDLNAKIKK